MAYVNMFGRQRRAQTLGRTGRWAVSTWQEGSEAKRRRVCRPMGSSRNEPQVRYDWTRRFGTY